MNAITMIGILAGALTTVAFVPQVIKSWRTRHTRDISLGMFSVLCLGLALWLTYGLLVHDVPIILANAVTFALATSILALKIRHG